MTCETTPLVHALADGELPPEEAERIRDHLASCSVCQNELADVIQLEAAVAESVRHQKAGVTPIRRRRWIPVVSGATLLAAAVALYVLARPKASSQREELVAVALPAHRTSEARLSWSGAAAHRPYEISRSAEGASAGVPLGALSDLDRRGDWHGVGALALINGDHRQAEAFFRRAPASPALAADRAALALAEGNPERALAAAEEALRAAPEHSAATWNRALALRDLGLSWAAAAAFSQVAALGEPGWSQEARARAAELEREATARKALTERVLAAGPLLSSAPQALSLDDARRLPGLARVYLYDALRSATSEQLVALAPLIEAVEGRAPNGPLGGLRQRMQALAQRSPGLVATYREISIKKSLPRAARAAFLQQLRAARADDLLIGALIHLSPSGYVVAEAELPELTRLAAASPDPWFRVLGLEQKAQVAILANRLPEAEAVLLRARQRCQAGDVPSYRCLRVSLLLADTYARWQRLAEARAERVSAWKLARSEGEWLTEGRLLAMGANLAVVTDDSAGSQLPLARAYAEELALRQPAACDVAITARYDLALTAVNQLRFEEARRELAELPACSAPVELADSLRRTLVLAHLVREESRSGGTASPQLVALRSTLAELRAAGPSPAQRAMIDHIEGRLIIDLEPAAGEALLRRAIASARQLAKDPALAAEALVKKAEAYSFSVLALAFARAGDGAAALATLSDELGLTVPQRCALGIAVEDQRRMAVVRSADGVLLVAYDEKRSSPRDDLRTVISPAQLAALGQCPVVDVLARPPVHGTSRLLPESVAWRYLSARRQPAMQPRGPSVVVADVEPPATLGLPRLATWQSVSGRTLSGASATPERVLAALADAGEVVIHAHGLGSSDASDAAFLALSADAGGRYALTAADVRGTTLRGNPLVVLAACNASVGAPVFHEPWSLPAAFVYAGARAVIASTAPIPDNEATAVVESIRTAVASGTPAAVALREVRQRALAAGSGEWVKDLLVFE